MNKIPLLVLFGPTASGKTNLAVEICEKFNGEVVTADSMQVYKYMDIGTAKPDAEERRGILHHMIDVVSPKERYDLSEYVTQAKKVIEDISSRGKLPVLAGGTGLYIDTLIENIKLTEIDNDFEYRKELQDLADKYGNEFIHNMLLKVDSESAQSIHPNNIKRVIRALEVYKVSGITQSEHIKNSRLIPSEYNTVKFGIQTDREVLYDRINKRVDNMIEKGLVEEVEKLKSMGLDESYTSMQGLGYKEILRFLDDKMTLSEATDILKQSTRRYAKRQMTWFKREENTLWIDVFNKKNMELFQKTMELYKLI